MVDGSTLLEFAIRVALVKQLVSNPEINVPPPQPNLSIPNGSPRSFRDALFGPVPSPPHVVHVESGSCSMSLYLLLLDMPRVDLVQRSDLSPSTLRMGVQCFGFVEVRWEGGSVKLISSAFRRMPKLLDWTYMWLRLIKFTASFLSSHLLLGIVL